MPIPENVTFDAGGPRYYDQFGKSKSLYHTNLKELQFHDFMKNFAQNIKETIGEKGVFPKGTQELLDSPYVADANNALTKYIDEKYGPDHTFKNAKVTSFTENSAGKISIEYDDLAKPGKKQTSSVLKTDIFANLDKKLVSPNLSSVREQKASSNIDLQKLGKKVDVKTATRQTATPRRSAMGARVSYSAAMETVGDNIENVLGRSRANRGLLSAATDASAAVAGGVEKSNALRIAGAAATILRKKAF